MTTPIAWIAMVSAMSERPQVQFTDPGKSPSIAHSCIFEASAPQVSAEGVVKPCPQRE